MPELLGPVLREGKLETGSVSTAKRPRPGRSADTSKGSCTRSPSLRASACPMASAPDSSSLEEWEPRSVLSSGVAATGRRVRTPGQGPKAVVERWAPPRWQPFLLGAPRPRGWGAASRSVGAAWTQSPWVHAFRARRCLRGA